MRPRNLKLALIVLAALMVLGSESFGQSGRKQTEKPAPVPIATPPPSVEPDPIPAKITSLVIGGEVTNNSLYFHSSYWDVVTKEFIFWMKYEPRPFLGVTKGGKMKFEDAKLAATKETDRHILWLNVSTKNYGLDGLIVEYVDYAILIPQTGRPLMTGRLIPGDQQILAQGGVMKIPNVNRRGTGIIEIKQAAREMAFKLKGTSWF